MSTFLARTRWFVCAGVCLFACASWGQDAHRLRAERFLRGRAGAVAADRAETSLRAKPRATGLSAAWTAVGPAQIASLSYGLVTGRVASVAIDPADLTGNTVYLGTTGGGVWKSTNAAGPVASVSFVPLTDTLPVFSGNAGTSAVASLSIGAVSVQPGVGTGAALLAGTGDPNDATDSYYGSGILRSVDGGNTWTLAQGSRDGVAGNHSFAGLGTAGFAWSTTTPGLVVAAMSQAVEGVIVNAVDGTNSVMGLFYSTDAGTTWQMATIQDGSQAVQTPLPSGANGAGNAATAVVWNPVRRKFYAAVRFHGVYESLDGIAWTRLAAQPGTGLSLTACPTNPGATGSPSCPFFRGSLAVQTATGDLFALSVDQSNLDQGLWQDVCAAQSGICASATVAWTTQIPSTILETGSGSTAIAQADYDLTLAAGALDAGDTVLFVGTVDLYRCAFANGSGAGCRLRNTTNALNGCASPAGVAPSQHALAIAAPLAYLGNDGGLWRSTDAVAETGSPCSTSDATHFQNLNGGLGSLAETVGLAVHPTNAKILAIGVGANGAALTSSATGAWPQVAAGEGGLVAIDQTTPANVYISTGPGVSLAYCGKGTACAATDFAGLATVGEAQVSNDAALVDAPLLLDPALQSDLLVGTCRVWRGPAASGSGWSSGNELSAAFGTASGGPCTAANPLARSLGAGGPVSPSNSSVNAGSTVLYAGMAGGIDGGGTLGGHVFGTLAAGTDGGTTAWTDLAGTNVTNDPADAGVFNPGAFDISSVVVDPHDTTGKTVYVTAMGFAGNGFNAPHVYRSVDGGAHWLNLSSNLPNAPANALAVDPNDANTVYVAMDTGVYVTTAVGTCAAGNCWSIYGVGLPNAPVVALVASAAVPTGDGRIGMLRAGTYGRGIWGVPLLTAYTPAAPGMTVAPTSLTFATQQVGTASAAQTVTVTNSGNTVVTVSSVTATADFTETNTCSSALSPAATCAVSVVFLPTATGARTGLLTVYANVPGGQATVALNGTAVAPAAVVLNPVQASFATTDVGSTSAVVDVTISNTGGTTVGLQSIALTGAQAGDFRISANTCGTSLPTQTGCTVSVVFRPAASGARSATLTVTDDVGVQTTSLSGTGTAPATDSLAPLALAFGPTVLNTASAGQDVTLTNAGDDALTLISATVTSGDFTAVNRCGNSLNGHSSCTVTVVYVPKSVGAETGLLTVADQFRTQTVTLSGTGLAPARVSLSPFAGIAFGVTAVGVASGAQPVLLTNNGGVALGIAGITLSGASFQIVAGSNTCGSSLAPGAACGLSVAFAPVAGGPQAGSLTFADTAGNSPQTLALTGTGVDFSLAASGATTVTIASGGSAVYPFLLTSATGTPGVASFTCLGAPANATCTVTPSGPPLGGSTSVIVTIATGVATTHGMLGVERYLWLAGLLPLFGMRRRLRRGWILGLLCVGLLGCGAGRLVPASGGTGGGGGTTTPTPSGSYSIAVSATSAGLTRTVNVTLVVQ
jgi:hypothetical protein